MPSPVTPRPGPTPSPPSSSPVDQTTCRRCSTPSSPASSGPPPADQALRGEYRPHRPRCHNCRVEQRSTASGAAKDRGRGPAMTVEILLALVASLFTATSSVAQRVAAAPAPGEMSLSFRLILFLMRRPVWFLG